METKQFKAESKRLLDLMINSIYTHKEIFLRELISNASDAIDKLYYRSLTDNIAGLTREGFSINIESDKENRVLKISDNGCGMTAEEIENNLGTIAKSGSLGFKKENEPKEGEDIDIIGQFGVGFYSAFMVSKNVTVVSRAYGEEKAYKWQSAGVDGYTLEECEMDGYGTVVNLEIKDNTEDENYDEFLEQHTIQQIVRKYSDYIRYPIKMNLESKKLKEGSTPENPEYDIVVEETTLNSMVPIWKKNKSELTDEDYSKFYKEKFFDYTDPARVIHSSTEGAATYNALMFIPSKVPYNYYTKEFKKGLQLYASGVLIMDKCEDLLPDHFSFVRGLVDSQDLSLNISRELLQHDRQLKVIASRLEKKIKSELKSMLLNQRDKYEEFFKNFGLQIKYGIYSGFGVNSDMLKDIIMFYSSTEKKLVTLEEYKGRMSGDQKYIYYACGESIEKIGKLPQTELVLDKGYEILYLTDDVDEFSLQVLGGVDGKEFKSVSSGDLGLESEEEKKEVEKTKEENKDMLGFMCEKLEGKIKGVRPSQRLKTHPVCLSSEGDVSIEMEKVLGQNKLDHEIKAEKFLEINASHPIFQKLTKLYTEDKDKLERYTKLLYTQALLIEGIPVEDPVEFSSAMCALMTE